MCLTGHEDKDIFDWVKQGLLISSEGSRDAWLGVNTCLGVRIELLVAELC